MSATCEFDWCESAGEGHKEHTWTDGVFAGRSRRAYVWTSLQEGFPKPVLVGIENPEDEGYGGEIWLSVEDATYLALALGQAIVNAKSGAAAGGAT
ncbi:hypothetical protein MCHIJ_30430 [Mycolicibacterium chitae]|uniref:Uncharacterized protein n=1 Tax=Mycolicibacterium chitae TaxID=1792 RepID=A0A3S5EI97_MYCCI|nr:hypothetical protein [Mycolicibacterium chitae]MCV7108919.1 hypothetical protein [Mycolicibacterium chitae]BBZ03606.1 hypothetical protein MCHIJ_30430 [Mycolicibacterium chitae]VEG47261.1 Uncharacterised protein [Mycolicibacterium chitae]